VYSVCCSSHGGVSETPPYREVFGNTALARAVFRKHRPIGRCLEFGIKTPPYFEKHRPKIRLDLNSALMRVSDE
jgi:hypothetical protein